MSKGKIISVWVYPPIPWRNFDWSAFRDGTEESGPVGYGRTKEEAIADLLQTEEENEILG